MSAVLPESSLDEFALSEIGISNVFSKLRVSFCLHPEADKTDTQTEVISQLEGLTCRICGNECCGRVHEDRKNELHHENVHEDLKVEFGGTVVLPSVAHVNISVVFAFVAGSNVIA